MEKIFTNVIAPVYAQPPIEGITISVPTPGGSIRLITDLGKLLSAAFSLLFIVAGIAAVLFLIQGGIGWITSGGDKAGVEAARNKIIHAIVGLIIVIATWALVVMLESFTGICILSCPIKIPTPF